MVIDACLCRWSLYRLQSLPITLGILTEGSSGSGFHKDGPQPWTCVAPCKRCTAPIVFSEDSEQLIEEPEEKKTN